MNVYRHVYYQIPIANTLYIGMYVYQKSYIFMYAPIVQGESKVPRWAKLFLNVFIPFL